MKTQLTIAREIVDSYCGRNYATINLDEVAYIEVNGDVLKDETRDDGDYVTIYANFGGTFSPEWEHSDIKLLFILKESYIQKYSFYQDGHRGGFSMNKLYDNNEDLKQNATYRNMVKITYFAYFEKQGMEFDSVDYNIPYVWDEACAVFRKHAAVISVNPFPGLAFQTINTKTALLNKWLSIPQVIALLQTTVQELDPKCIFAAFDLGRVSSYGNLFGWLKGRPLEELLASEGEQTVLGRKICSGGVREQRTFVIDECNVRWIQGIHPSAILSHKKMRQMAQVISFGEY